MRMQRPDDAPWLQNDGVWPRLVTVRIDSIAHGDSIYARYYGDLGRLVSRNPFVPGLVAGLVRGDSASLIFEPDVRDGALEIDVMARGHRLEGRWLLRSNLHAGGGALVLPM